MSTLQLPSFSPKPRKEGRFHPCDKNRQRQTAVRVVLGVVALAICYVLLVSISAPIEPEVAIQKFVPESERPNRTIFESQSPLEYESHPPIKAEVLSDEHAPSPIAKSEVALEPTPSAEPEVKKSKSIAKAAKVESSDYDGV